MRTVDIQPDDTALSRLLDDVASGEEIVLSKSGHPIAKLVPLDNPKTRTRRLGGLQGQFVIPDDFDAPLPDEIQRALEGRS